MTEAAAKDVVRVAVVGVGSMGAHHVRLYDNLAGVELVAVVDANEACARAVGEKYRCAAYKNVDEIVGKVDAVSIAVPSTFHHEVGCYLLEANISCLVEKPLATNEEDCLALIASAEHSSATLMVGHVERFNPVVRQIKEILQDGHAVLSIDARRMSWGGRRIKDVDVILDLMIHDLDVVLHLTGASVRAVQAAGCCLPDSVGADHASALLAFDNGSFANLTASRITQNKIRELQVVSDLRYFSANYSTQELLIYRGDTQVTERVFGPRSGGYVLDLAIERVFVRQEEPLRAEIEHFLDSVRYDSEPSVTGQQALECLRVAWAIQNALQTGSANGGL